MTRRGSARIRLEVIDTYPYFPPDQIRGPAVEWAGAPAEPGMPSVIRSAIWSASRSNRSSELTDIEMGEEAGAADCWTTWVSS